MAAFFFDASALVKRYVVEAGTGWGVGVASPRSGNQIYIVRITGVEVVSAIARRRRRGTVSAADSAKIIADFQRDLTFEYRVLDISPSLLASAMHLADARALRGYDAVQLAAALKADSRRGR